MRRSDITEEMIRAGAEAIRQTCEEWRIAYDPFYAREAAISAFEAMTGVLSKGDVIVHGLVIGQSGVNSAAQLSGDS